MPVVLVRRGRMTSESAVLLDVEWQFVVDARQHRIAVADLDELGWERSIEGPDGERTLGGQARVELGRDQASSTDARIQTGRHARVIDRVRLRAFLRHLDGDPGREIVESLVGPDGSWRAAVDRTGVTRFDTFERGVEQLLGGIGPGGRRRTQRRDRVPRQNVEPQHRLREWLDAEQRAWRQAGRNVRAGEGALRKWAQAILQDDGPGGGEQAQFDQVSA